MNVYVSIGTKIVFIALLFYSIGIFTEQKKKHVTNIVLSFITLGIVFDITATTFMIIGSSNEIFTLHGVLGYSSLTAMFIDAVLLWRYRLKNGADTQVNKGLHLYSRIAYIWWVLAFITGGALVMLK
jgi:heme A synthase